MLRRVAALAILLAAATARAETVELRNGDRVTGRVVGTITKRVRLQTPFGVLLIPIERIDRIVRGDGTEQRFGPPPEPLPPPPPPSPAALALAVSGASFWHAWDPKGAPADPSLRLELRLDDQPIASYTDVNLDPEDLPKAVVNSFVFSPERLFVSGAEGITAATPSLGSSEIRLELKLPSGVEGEHRLTAAYQLNDASSTQPSWRDVVVAAATVTLAAGHTSRLRLLQDRGAMEFSRSGLRGPGRMKGVESFRATLEAVPAEP